MQIQVTIEGVTPLLMNRFTDEAEIATTSGHSPAFQGGGRDGVSRWLCLIMPFCQMAPAGPGKPWLGAARSGVAR